MVKAILITIIIVLLVAIFKAIMILLEIKRYNNGVCPVCGTKMHIINDDDHLRGYLCPNCSYDVWVRNNIDLKRE